MQVSRRKTPKMIKKQDLQTLLQAPSRRNRTIQQLHVFIFAPFRPLNGVRTTLAKAFEASGQQLSMQELDNFVRKGSNFCYESV